jgi:shikimate O-hydroxycinnamoyltransferase
MKNIPLSPIDHVFTGTGSYPIEFVFAYEGLIDAKKLLAGFKQTLAYFPPMQCKLVNQEGRYWFQEDDAGFHFEVTDQAINFDDTEEREIFIDPVTTRPGEPLTRIRLTQTPNGSVLGVSISHSIADGFSYFYFLASWAKIFHGKGIFPPSHQRELLIPKQAKKIDVSASELLINTGLFIGEKRKDIQRDQLKWETIGFKSTELKAIHEDAQKSCDVRLSHNDVIVASLWKKYMAEWNTAKEDHPTYINCPFDYRRMMPDFPKNYFGNAVTLASTELSYNQLMSADPAELAILVRAGIGSINERYILEGLKTLNALTKTEGVLVNERIHVCDPANGLLVTNLSRLPVRDIEFNAGPPKKYEILTPANRGAVILPGSDGDGVEVRVCCPV